MTALAQEILKNFDQLPDTEQQKVALEILKRIVHSDFPHFPSSNGIAICSYLQTG
jgi:hypothetical protein